MRSALKRSHGEDSSSSPSSKIGSSKTRRHHHHHYHRSISPASDFPANYHHPPPRNPHREFTGKRLNFISYTEIPSLPPKLKVLCQIVAETPSATVERVLEDTGIRVSEADVEEVLKLSYRHPGPAVKFFRWSSLQLNGRNSEYAWNLVVDLLGKNSLYDAMWDAIRSMAKEMLLSLSTFSSVFSSYVMDSRVRDAIMSFESMDRYGIPRDVLALNSLLDAICKDGKTWEATDYMLFAKQKIRVNGDTYAILLKGWEKEGNVNRARDTFSDMVVDVGWDSNNVPAYDSFLCTLLTGPDGTREVLKFLDTMRDRGCYPGKGFFKLAIDECVRKSDSKCARAVWEIMVGKKIYLPDIKTYKSLISLYCNVKDFDSAERLLDEMVYNGAFPDSETYRLMFHFLIKHRRLREATPLFKEMLKNEFVPLQEDCIVAVKEYVDAKDPYMGIKVWRCMVENYHSDLEETGNLLVVGLREMNRVPEAVKCAEDMIERGIKLNSSTLSKLKQSLSKAGKAFAYEELLHKWKGHY
ncbi:Unknown protein [Striga hermonthica]|uniref:Pentatricopeptide repeat-containing protein n=1 Tax=Striga hermonthica TaxID=68872 RepID=A0A9N7NZ11_STRHE|nr:Unknown protein [Striga hermonthica]